MGLTLNHNDPSECFVLFPTAAPMQEIYSLSFALAKQLKSLEIQELQQIMSALQQEMKSRRDASLGPAQDVSLHPSDITEGGES